MNITDNNTMIFTDDQATALLGDNWVGDLRHTDGHMFFDGIEFYAEILPLDQLELIPVHEDTDLKNIFE